VLVTVRCPADGVVGVSVADLRTVVVRSGSDVEVTYACPLCGSPIVLSASVEPGLAALAGPAGGCRIPVPGATRKRALERLSSRPLRRREDRPRIDAYAEYFRRELAHTDTVDAMIAEMDARRR
jgi:hypothetical protein